MGIIVPLWIWLPVVLLALWRWEHRQRVREVQPRFLEYLQRINETPPIFLPPAAELRAHKSEKWAIGNREMRSFWLVAAFGVISAVYFAWEPTPKLEQAAQPAVASEAPAVAQAPANINIPAPPNIPAGMIYDPAHNSFHYPPGGHP